MERTVFCCGSVVVSACSRAKSSFRNKLALQIRAHVTSRWLLLFPQVPTSTLAALCHHYHHPALFPFVCRWPRFLFHLPERANDKFRNTPAWFIHEERSSRGGLLRKIPLAPWKVVEKIPYNFTHLAAREKHEEHAKISGNALFRKDLTNICILYYIVRKKRGTILLLCMKYLVFS